jgi:DNA adenine methylase
MQANHKSAINISCVPTPSPFRYPGGKSWLIPIVRQWLQDLDGPIHFAEPFAGGANVGLTVAIENLADSVTLVELDPNVASVWQTVLNGGSAGLTRRIVEFQMSKKAVKALLVRRCNSAQSRAFATIVKNRVRRGGIMTEGAGLLKHGENGNGVKSRWYPETLKRRIEKIAEHRDQITFLQKDGLEYIREESADETVAFFIDPPYAIAGQRLYTHSDIDHRKLFELVAGIKGKVLMTYDDSAEVRALARKFGFSTRRVPMRTSHHSQKAELLISRDFSWFNPRAVQPKQELGRRAAREKTKG